MTFSRNRRRRQRQRLKAVSPPGNDRVEPEPSNSGSGALEESALELLLRSPRLDIGQIMELLDVGDRELREFARSNPRIANLLEQRRLGALAPAAAEPRQCGSCEEWFLPYASDRYCSDACKRAARLK